ncbi:MAG: hypothetical protein ACI83P_001228 [Janthinobacterium sp.]|jgi:hypothetical protein
MTRRLLRMGVALQLVFDSVFQTCRQCHVSCGNIIALRINEKVDSDQNRQSRH